MSRYRKIDPRTWKDEKFRQLDQFGKLIALYCITAQSNRCGIFNFSRGQAAEDLDLELRRFRSVFATVCKELRWEWDEAGRVLYIPTWWKYNPPENANVLKSCLSDLHELPETPLLDRFRSNLGFLSPDLVPAFETSMENGVLAATENETLRRWLRSDEKLRELIKRRDRNQCRYCAQKVDWSDRRGPLGGTYDHIDPNRGNSLENVVVSCRSCNSKKGARTPAAAGMVLSDLEQQPRSDLGRPPDTTKAVSSQQEQKQDQEQELDQGTDPSDRSLPRVDPNGVPGSLFPETEPKITDGRESGPPAAPPDDPDKGKRKHVLPKGWNLTELRREVALRYGLHPEGVFEAFTNYWWGCGRVMVDWDATWVTWCRRENEKQVKSGGTSNGRVTHLSAAQQYLAEKIAETGGRR